MCEYDMAQRRVFRDMTSIIEEKKTKNRGDLNADVGKYGLINRAKSSKRAKIEKI